MADETGAPASDRREHLVLRELLDELIDHVRGISKRGGQLSAKEVEYAQQRMDWLADEVWQLALKGEPSDAQTQPR